MNCWRYYVSIVLWIFLMVPGFAAGAGNQAVADPVHTFLQTASGGSFGRNDQGHYVLILKNVSQHTSFFSDSPKRDIGAVKTTDFLHMMTFDEKSPPKAAVVVLGDTQDRSVIIGELLDPEYDAATNTLTYRVAILPEAPKELESWSDEADATLPAQFKDVRVIFGHCPDTYPLCFGTVRCTGRNCCPVVCGALPSPPAPVGQCWTWSSGCQICHPGTAQEYCDESGVCNQGSANPWCASGACTIDSPCA